MHTDATDMRKSFSGLCGIIRSVFGDDPADGSILLFVNHHRDRIKALQWHGDGLVNYSTFATETGVASKTIREYYQVLEDTLTAFAVPPYTRSARKRLTRHPIYHLFDLGVCNALAGRLAAQPIRGTSAYGRLFEQFIVLDLKRLLTYRELDWLNPVRHGPCIPKNGGGSQCVELARWIPLGDKPHWSPAVCRRMLVDDGAHCVAGNVHRLLRVPPTDSSASGAAGAGR